jgi:hypothetical protein
MDESRAEQVDLRQMGVWGGPVRVQLADRYEEVWIQTVGDRTEALERGHDAMQQKLLEFRPGGERAAAITEALKLAPPSDVVDLVLGAERPKIEAGVHRELPDPVTPRQDRAARETDEAFARRKAGHEQRCQELSCERLKRFAQLLEEREAELRALPPDELVELARPRRIDIECWNAFARTCDDWVLLRAVRRAEDHDRPYFNDIAEVQALHPAVKDQLRRAYRALEPTEADALPKSSAASPSSASTT